MNNVKEKNMFVQILPVCSQRGMGIALQYQVD